MGFAKAAEPWMGEHRALILDRLARPGVPDIRGYLPFVELHFLANWMQRAFMERKWQYVDAGRFEPLRHAERVAARAKWAPPVQEWRF